MKTINAIIKVLTALATIAGAVYIIATYGDQIVEWAKEIWNKLPGVSTTPAPVFTDVKAPAAETPAEETAAEAEDVPAEAEPVAETSEAPAEETPAVEENAPVADEADFEG